MIILISKSDLKMIFNFKLYLLLGFWLMSGVYVIMKVSQVTHDFPE